MSAPFSCLPFDWDAMITLASSGMPPALAISFWIVRREASCEMAPIARSLAFVDDELSRRDSKGAMPPASTIESRLASESDARLARAAAACSSPPASLPLSYSMPTSL